MLSDKFSLVNSSLHM